MHSKATRLRPRAVLLYWGGSRVPSRAGAVLARRGGLVRVGVRRAHGGAGGRLGRDRLGEARAGLRAHRVRKDARGVSLGDRPARGRPGADTGRPRALRLAAEGAGRRHRAEPARAAGGHSRCRRAARPRAAQHHHGAPDRRHAGGRAPPAREASAGHPRHHARVALPAAHVRRTRRAPQRRDGHRGRGPCGGGDEARGPSGAQPRAPRLPAAGARTAHRPVGDGAAAGGGGALSRRRAAGRGRRGARRQAARPLDRGAGRGPGRARAARRTRAERERVRRGGADQRLAARGGAPARRSSARTAAPSCSPTRVASRSACARA